MDGTRTSANGETPKRKKFAHHGAFVLCSKDILAIIYGF